jgi:hypothetical protein
LAAVAKSPQVTATKSVVPTLMRATFLQPVFKVWHAVSCTCRCKCLFSEVAFVLTQPKRPKTKLFVWRQQHETYSRHRCVSNVNLVDGVRLCVWEAAGGRRSGNSDRRGEIDRTQLLLSLCPLSAPHAER